MSSSLSSSLLSSFLSFSLNCLLGPWPARPRVTVARAPLRQVHSARLGSYFSVCFCCLFSSSLFPSIPPSFHAQSPRISRVCGYFCSFICLIFRSKPRKPHSAIFVLFRKSTLVQFPFLVSFRHLSSVHTFYVTLFLLSLHYCETTISFFLVSLVCSTFCPPFRRT